MGPVAKILHMLTESKMANVRAAMEHERGCCHGKDCSSYKNLMQIAGNLEIQIAEISFEFKVGI